MSITVVFECSGCFTSTPATRRPERTFHSISGRDYGFGHYEYDSFQDIAPEGWVAFDPYTGCTYCPDCWNEIEAAVAHATDAKAREEGK